MHTHTHTHVHNTHTHINKLEAFYNATGWFITIVLEFSTYTQLGVSFDESAVSRLTGACDPVLSSCGFKRQPVVNGTKV